MSNVFHPKGPKRFEHQRKGLRKLIETGGVAALLFDPGLGKGLHLDTEVPTPSGWTTMGDLRTGDKVIDADGKPTTVIAHDPYEARCWRLTFSDGTQVVCDEDHLWVTEDRLARRRAQYQSKVGRVLKRYHKKPQFEVRDTATIVKTLFRDSDGGANHRVEMAGAFRPDAMEPVLPLDPYLLGYWLGDGTSAAPRISVGHEDVEWVKAQLPMFSSQSVDKRTGVVTLGMGRGSFDQLGKVLRDMGLYGNKHVPQTYLRSAASRRLDLLRGLMDSDGAVSKDDGHVEFCSTRQELAEGVRELACSLGERAVIKESDATLNGEIKGRRWRVTWTPEQFDPFRMPRKSTEPRRLRDSGRYITSAEYMGVQTVRCLTVDSPTAQYLITRSWVPTHNTAVVLDYASILALKSRSGEARVLVVAPLAAVDTWVIQSETYVHDSVNVWAEVLGGSIRQRALALSARGGAPAKPAPGRGPRDSWQGPRAAFWHRAWARHIRGGSGVACEGPDGLGTAKPRLLIEVINLDTLSSRAAVCRCHWESKCPDGRKKSITIADAVVDGIRRYSPDLVVVDESHKIKGVTAHASRVMARVTDFVRRRVLLTGTVMPHSPLDVFAQWRFLEPYAFGARQMDGSVKKATFGNFKSRYAQLGGWMGKEVVGFQNLDEMQRIMAINAIVARKEDALDLPKTTTITVPVHLTASEKSAYKDMTDNLQASLPTGTVTVNNWLTQAMRLRQITSGHMPDDQGNVHVIGQSKVNTIRSLVQDTLVGEKRIVVFALFTEEIRLLKEALSSMKGEAAAEVMTITGATPVEERLRLRKRFGVQPEQDPTRMILVAQIKTISLSVNELVTANHAIFASLSQQRDDIIQAQDRLNRLGQTRPVTFWYALAPGTVDEVIMKSHRDRTNLEAAMLSHIKQVHENGVIDVTEVNDGLVATAMADVFRMAGFG